MLTLDTADGPLDLLVSPDGAAPYEQLRERAVSSSTSTALRSASST